MAFFKGAKNVLIRGGSSSDVGSVHTYNSFVSACSSCTTSSTLSPPSGADSLSEISGSWYTAEEERTLHQNLEKRKPFGFADETAGGQVQTYHYGTVVVRSSINKLLPYKGGPLPSRRASNRSRIKHGARKQSSRGLELPRYQGAPPNLTLESPPMISSPTFQLRTVAQSEPPSTLSGSRSDNPHHNQFIHVPPANRPLPTSEQGKASMTPSQRSKLLPPIETRLIRPNDATSRQYTPPNQIPATATLPGPKFQAPAINSCLHTGLDPNMLLSPILQPFPGAVQPPNITANERNDTSLQPNRHPDHYLPKSPQATNSPQNSPDTNSKRLEHLLDAALETALTTALIIQTSGGSAEILSPRAHNTLQMLNALVSAETPVSSPNDMASNPHTRFKSVRNVASWLRIPRSPK